MALAWFLLALVCLVIAIRLVSRRDADPYARAEEQRPPELEGAVVVVPRTKMRMTTPFRLHGEPDVVYRLRDGMLVVREDKSFFPHPVADRIQASVYACILRHNPPPALRGCQVAPYAWVRYGMPGRTEVRWVKVSVYTDEEMAVLVERYRAILAGASRRPTRDPGYCEKVCQHFGERCPGTRKLQRAPATVH